MQQWNVGDTVMLKSGGPDMTVVETGYDNEGVRCVWFDGANTKEGIFPAGALVKS